MRRWVKVAAWAAVFLACAGIGATIAAHTDPFPPGVDRQGSRRSRPCRPPRRRPPRRRPSRWCGSGRSAASRTTTSTSGGRCTTRWRGNLRFDVDPSGTIAGSGAARLYGKLACDFPIAQTQLQRIGLAVTGHVRGDRMTLILTPDLDRPDERPRLRRLRCVPADEGRVTRPPRHRAGTRRSPSRGREQGRGIYFWSTGVPARPGHRLTDRPSTFRVTLGPTTT